MRFASSAFLIIFVLSFVGCAPRLLLKRDADVKSIGICLDYDSSTTIKEISQYFDSSLIKFVDLYNSEKHKFQISKCIDQSKSSLIININSTNLIGPSRQAAGIMLSAVGISLPFILLAANSPIWVAFAYFPQNNTRTYVSLSDDIAGNEIGTLSRNFYSSPYFGSIERQKLVHSKRFVDFLSQILTEIENSYK